jgi:hypothetical protein
MTIATIATTVGIISSIVLAAGAVLDAVMKWRALHQSPAPGLGAGPGLLIPGRSSAPIGIGPAWLRGPTRWFTRPLLLATAAVLLLVSGLTLGRAIAPNADSGPRYPDGTNPMTTDCPTASRVADRVPITVPANHLFGWVELRDAPGCGMAWGRVVPLPGEPITGPVHVVVRIVRPADDRRDEYAYSKPTQAVFTNMLRAQTACAYAEGQVSVDGETSAPVRTACLRADYRWFVELGWLWGTVG